jgi:transposase
MTAPVLEQLDVAAARAGTDRLRLTLTDAHEQLIALHAGRAHVALGYGPGLAGWRAYLAAEFGELLHVVPTAEQLVAMVDAGMSQREAAAPFGVSLGKVNGLLQARTAAPTSTPADDERPTYVQVAAVVAAAGVRGLTIPQAQRRLGWSYGATSGALSRAERRGLVTRPGHLEQRGGFRPYTAPH